MRELARGEEANPQTNSYPPRVDQKIAQPGVPSGNEELRQLNRSRESEQRDELKQTALRIPVLSLARLHDLSPAHALYLDGVLMRVSGLVNGRSIVRCSKGEEDRLTYFQRDIEDHQVIFAEGAPVELCLGDGMIPFAPIWFESRKSQLASRLRSAISPWIDRRKVVDKVRDHLEVQGKVTPPHSDALHLGKVDRANWYLVVDSYPFSITPSMMAIGSGRQAMKDPPSQAPRGLFLAWLRQVPLLCTRSRTIPSRAM